MADPIIPLKDGFTRILTVNLIPGFVASIPFIIVIQNHYKSVGDFLQNHTEILILLSTIIFYTIGIFLEDIGSVIEGFYSEPRVIKRIVKEWSKNNEGYENSTRKEKTNIRKSRTKQEKESHAVRWNQYLNIRRVKDEIVVGDKFINVMVTRLKFELTMGLALTICYFGLYSFQTELIDIKWWQFILLSIVPMYLIIWESPKTAHTLDNTRKALLDNIGTVQP